MNIPLVSEYKVPFILQRLLETLLGGFEMTCASPLLLRVAIYLIPSGLGMVATVLIDYHLMDPYIGLLTIGIGNFLFVFAIHLIAGIQRESVKANLVAADKSKTSLQQLIPRGGHHSTLAALAVSLMAASLVGLMVHTFKPGQLMATFERNTALATCVYVLAWFSFIVAHHSLTMGPAPETAAYSMTFNKADSFNRPVHLLLVLSLLSVIPEHLCPHSLLLLFVCLLPILWLLGIMPPIQSSVHHCLEQINTLLLGGTASWHVFSLLATVLLSGGTVLLAHFFLALDAFLLVSALLAFLVSNKWLHNWSHVVAILPASKILITLAVIVALAYLPGPPNDSALTVILVGFLAVIQAAKHSQRIYLFNWIKNPLNVLLSASLLRSLQSNRVCIMSVRIGLHCVLPFISLLLVLQRISKPEISSRLGETAVSSVLLNLLVFRLFRQLWQEPLGLAAQLLAIPQLDVWLAEYRCVEWPVELKHFAVSFVLGMAVDFGHKLYLMLVLLWSSVFIKKQRLQFSGMLFVFNILILPLNLSIILLSCFLRAPILPLFTLPIFLLSFPRPLQFWSTTPTTISPNTTDAYYYQQILPRLVQSLREQRLFWDFCRAGEFLLARYEDRLMWMQVLEAGHNYVALQLKGLELQETSCHAIEASAIDHLIENAFGEERRMLFNSHPLYTISPVTRVSVRTYSVARNVLTGIIDSPETYGRIKGLYCQVLIWLLMQRRIATLREEHSKAANQFASAQRSILKSAPKKKHKKNAVGDIEAASNYSPVVSLSYESLQPNMQWTNASYQYSKMKGSSSSNQSPGHQGCNSDWFEEALRVHSEDACKLNGAEVQSLNLSYRNITNVCYSLLFPPVYTEVPTSQSICQIFNGEVVTEDVDKQFFESNADLFAVCIKSFQYSAKIAFDQIIFSNEDLSNGELSQILQEFDQNWYFGNRTMAEWKDAVIAEKGNLFTVGKDLVKENYTSHLLSLQDMDIYVCSLNRATIEAIWSSLSLELFYLTNDDEERYSIQAHQIILRNLTVQAADPPLGYPVFATEPTIISHLA